MTLVMSKAEGDNKIMMEEGWKKASIHIGGGVVGGKGSRCRYVDYRSNRGMGRAGMCEGK